jgi:hypothetical protein
MALLRFCLTLSKMKIITEARVSKESSYYSLVLFIRLYLSV